MIRIEENKNIFSKVQEKFEHFFPKTAESVTFENSQNLFSKFTLELPASALQQAQAFVKEFYTLAQKPDYQQSVLSESLKLHDHSPIAKPSVLCCFDFHYNEKSQELKLIEVNTNASGFLVGSLAFEGWDISTVPFKDELVRSFKESDLLSKNTLFIMDEKPEQQKMYLEFLLYKEFFENQNQETLIIDSKLLNEKFLQGEYQVKDFSVYNRDTDFYLENLKGLKEAYWCGELVLSPHPLDYDLLAKKTNLQLLLNYPDTSDEFKSHLLQSGLVQEQFSSYDELFAARKNLFFKPPAAFGGKSIYKGASVSGKYLHNIWDQNLLFQQSFPAGKFLDSHEQTWKYDLRFYTYNGMVQFYLARVYQGQITNFKVTGGGFAPVVFV